MNGTILARLQWGGIVRITIVNHLAAPTQNTKTVSIKITPQAVNHSQNAQTMYQEGMVVHQNQVSIKLVKTMQPELPVKMPQMIP